MERRGVNTSTAHFRADRLGWRDSKTEPTLPIASWPQRRFKERARKHAALGKPSVTVVVVFTRHTLSDRTTDPEGLLVHKRGDARASNGLERSTCPRDREITDRKRPQIVHVHNTLPLISPAVFYAARAAGAAESIRFTTIH